MADEDHGMKQGNRRAARVFVALAGAAIAVTIGLLVAHGRNESKASPAPAPADTAPDRAASGGMAAATRTAVDSSANRTLSRATSRTSTLAPLPPPDAPLAQTYHELKARADAGDAAAAARLYADVNRCFEVRERLRSLPLQASFLGDAPASLSADQLAQRDRRLAGIEQELRQAKEDAAPCNGLSDEQLRLPPVALTAARLGDKDASDCYVSGMLLFTGGILDHPEWLSQYRDNALTIANSALAAGDWNMVDELQRAYAEIGFHFGPLGDLVHEDAAMNYRLLRLQRLGATNPHDAENLDRTLAAAAQNLPADAISAGDAWAQDTFTQYFSNAPPKAGNRGMGCK